MNVARKFSIEEVPPNLYLCITSNGMVQSTVTWANSTGEENLADIHQLPACTCDHRFARLIPGPPPCACILITAGMRSIAPERLVHRKFHRLNYHQHLSSLMGEWTFAHKDGLQVNPARLPPDNVPNKPGRPKKKRMERMKVAPGRPPKTRKLVHSSDSGTALPSAASAPLVGPTEAVASFVPPSYSLLPSENLPTFSPLPWGEPSNGYIHTCSVDSLLTALYHITFSSISLKDVFLASRDDPMCQALQVSFHRMRIKDWTPARQALVRLRDPSKRNDRDLWSSISTYWQTPLRKQRSNLFGAYLQKSQECTNASCPAKRTHKKREVVPIVIPHG